MPPSSPPLVILGIVGWFVGYGAGLLLEWAGGPDWKLPLAIAFASLGALCGLLSMEGNTSGTSSPLRRARRSLPGQPGLRSSAAW